MSLPAIPPPRAISPFPASVPVPEKKQWWPAKYWTEHNPGSGGNIQSLTVDDLCAIVRGLDDDGKRMVLASVGDVLRLMPGCAPDEPSDVEPVL